MKMMSDIIGRAVRRDLRWHKYPPERLARAQEHINALKRDDDGGVGVETAAGSAGRHWGDVAIVHNDLKGSQTERLVTMKTHEIMFIDKVWFSRQLLVCI